MSELLFAISGFGLIAHFFVITLLDLYFEIEYRLFGNVFVSFSALLGCVLWALSFFNKIDFAKIAGIIQ